MEEDELASQLKSMCDENGKETNLQCTSSVLHKLAQIYSKRNPDKINFIQCAALYNAAIARLNQNKEKIENQLVEFCKKILKQANSKQPNEDFVLAAKTMKKKLIKLRVDVQNQLNNLIGNDIESLESLEQDKINQVRHLQDKITTNYIKIMADLSDYCLKIMGKATCKFAVVGMGSLSRKEVTPYSDFEHVILLEEGVQTKSSYDEVLEYFRWYSVIFHVVIINLRETILPSVSIYCLNNKDSELGDWFYDAFTTRGISFDGMMPHACKFPLGRQELTKDKPWKTELIKPVSEMLKYLTTEEDLKNGYHLKDILTKVCFVYGDKNIFDDFKSQMYKMLEQDDEQSKMNEIKRQILEDLEKFSTRSTLPEIISSKEFNLKKVIYRSTTLFISALGRLYNVRASSSFEIIERLAERNKISENARNKLMYAVALACEIRLKWYMQCRSQNDLIKCHSMEESAIKVLLKLTPKQNIIFYFQIAYALQCDVSYRLNLKKKFFYANPELLNTTLYYCLGEMQKLIEFTKQKKTNNNQTRRLYSFDESLERLQIDNKQNQTEEKFYNQQKINNQFQSSFDEQIAIAFYFRECGNHLLNLQNYDEALEYYKNQNQIFEQQQKILSNSYFGLDSKNCNEIQIEGLRTDSNIIGYKASQKKSSFTIQQNEVQNVHCIDFDREIGISWLSIGQCLTAMNKLDEAMNYLKQSLEYFERKPQSIESNEDISIALREVGCCLIAMKNYTEALSFLNKSLKIHESLLIEVSSDRGKTILYNDIGNCLMNIGKLNNAVDYFKQSLDIQQKIPFVFDSDNLISVTLQELGSCFMKMKKFPEALRYFQQSLQFQQEISHDPDSDRQIAIVHYHLGSCLARINRLDEAMACFDQALKIEERRSLGDEPGEVVSAVCQEAGSCLMKMNRVTDANHYFEKANASKQIKNIAEKR